MNNPTNVSERIQERIRAALGSDDAFASDIANLRDKLSSEFDAELRIHESQTRLSRQEVITGAIKAVVASEQVESSIDSRIAGLLLRQADLEVPLRTALNRVERACALHFILLAVNDGKPDHHALSDNRIREVLDRLVDQEQVSVIRKTDNYGESEEIIQRGPAWTWTNKILRYIVGLDKEGKIQVAGLFLRALGILATIGIAVWLGPSPAVCDFPVISAMGWCQSPESSMPVSQAASTQALPTPIQASTAPPTQSPAPTAVPTQLPPPRVACSVGMNLTRGAACHHMGVTIRVHDSGNAIVNGNVGGTLLNESAFVSDIAIGGLRVSRRDGTRGAVWWIDSLP